MKLILVGATSLDWSKPEPFWHRAVEKLGWNSWEKREQRCLRCGTNIYLVDLSNMTDEVDIGCIQHWENLISAFWQGCPLWWRCPAKDSVGSPFSSSAPAPVVLHLSLVPLRGETAPRRGWQVEFWGRPSSLGSPAVPPSVGGRVGVGMPLKEAGLSGGGQVGGFLEMCFASFLDHWERGKFALWDGLVLTNVLGLPPFHLNPTGGALPCRLRAPTLTCGNDHDDHTAVPPATFN